MAAISVAIMLFGLCLSCLLQVRHHATWTWVRSLECPRFHDTMYIWCEVYVCYYGYVFVIVRAGPEGWVALVGARFGCLLSLVPKEDIKKIDGEWGNDVEVFFSDGIVELGFRVPLLELL
ncbi:hypothetical protein M6B38_366465 [Iris pallida]|uniref:Uncharacterized protein n=1 Tax=Iris pallida TaxID=29817 RepID=A0AAX6GGT9_IRIPA|nr:hypothetical protein M6B38_366465 [Iris pallida]